MDPYFPAAGVAGRRCPEVALRRLASHIGRLSPAYDVVVVGSGYGGAVIASRMARPAVKGYRPRVCVLERGREFVSGEFPGTARSALRQMQVELGRLRLGPRTGLFDFRIYDDISVLQGCGLGGTSLINAGVVIQPLREILEDERWPPAFRADVAQGRKGPWGKAVARARRMLAARPLPGVLQLAKYRALREAAELDPGMGNGSGGRVRPVKIAVRTATQVDSRGVQHMVCQRCGDCVSGCNHGAKGTLDTNYLADARANGAELFCGVRVLWIEPGSAGGPPWRVWFELSDTAHSAFPIPPLFITADTVFLGAGALGSTEILLRSKERGLALSDRIGSGFSGNGDAIAWGYNNDRIVEGVGFGNGYRTTRAPVGATITGMIDERRNPRAPLLIQDGAIPGALAPLLRVMAPLVAGLGGIDTDTGWRARMSEWRRELATLCFGARRGALRRTQTYLVMSHEENSGTLVRRRGRLRIVWKGVGRQAIFQAVAARLEALTRALGGTHVVNPVWGRLFGRRLVTVHPLGGCCMGADAEAGVVDHSGAVFRATSGTDVHEGLFVVDGAVIPRALGANPLLTITAIAERTADIVRARIGLEEAERDAYPPSTVLPRRDPVGICVTERMQGRLRLGDTVSRLRLTLSIGSADVGRMLQSSTREASAMGAVEAPALSPRPLTVIAGRFRLFPQDPDRVETWRMVYDLPLASVEGRRYWMRGAKVLHGGMSMRRAWPALSTLDCTLHDAETGPPIGRARIRIGFLEVLRMVAAARFPGGSTRRERTLAAKQFARFFIGNVIRAAAWPIRSSEPIDPFCLRPRTADRPWYAPDKHRVLVEDGVSIVLTRVNRDAKGPPVLLAPGFGMSTGAFTLPGITSLAEYLLQQEYDPWLFDYRSSALTGSYRTQHTVDDIVKYDYPAAVQHVLQQTGQPSVHFMGHCVGSLALLLAIASRSLDPDTIRSAVCSQTFFMLDAPLLNRIKARLHLATILRASGFQPVMTPEHDRYAPAGATVLDRLLCFLPTRERCRSPVCRRILFMYGEVVLHDQITARTHAAMYDMFNAANLTTLEHMSRIVRRRHAVDAQGEHVYIRPENGSHFRLPVTLLQGERNNAFLPSGGRRTHAWLQANGAWKAVPGAYQLEMIPRYGHLDCFIGRAAHEDVFPRIADAFRRGDSVRARHEPLVASGS